MLETHHAPTYYFPPEDVSATLIPAQGRSFCEWKGVAQYFDVTGGSATVRAAAWSYEDPTEPFAPIAGYLAFYASLMEECRVGDLLGRASGADEDQCERERNETKSGAHIECCLLGLGPCLASSRVFDRTTAGRGQGAGESPTPTSSGNGKRVSSHKCNIVAKVTEV